MKAMFSNVKQFAVFNAKPQLFSYSKPYQLAVSDVDGSVFVDLKDGCKKTFKARVEQFGGVVLTS